MKRPEKRIEVKLSLTVVAPLLDLIKNLAAELASGPTVDAGVSEQDPELGRSWTDDLVAGQRSDAEVLLSLFDERFFAEGVVRLDGSNAEATARACSALRLRLRELRLKSLSDEMLEAGDVDIDGLDAPRRKALMCYLFLASIQELIVQHLDESIIGK